MRQKVPAVRGCVNASDAKLEGKIIPSKTLTHYMTYATLRKDVATGKSL
jgi:hypothetical protein